MPISRRAHPELQHRPPEHPCEGCGHAVSKYRWEFLGRRVCCRCEETGAGQYKAAKRDGGVATDERHVREAERKRRTLQERGNAMGAPGKLAGKGPEIVKRHDVKCETFAALAREYGASGQAVKDAYTKAKALTAAVQPVRVYHRETAPTPPPRRGGRHG
jgi:hypothetical protein